MDLDAYAAAHAPTWARLAELTRRARGPRRLAGDELDELVDLYQRTATHLSVVRTQSPDPAVVARLTALVAAARAALAGGGSTGWRGLAAAVTRTFPLAAWRARWWWLGTAAATLLVAVGSAVWLARDPAARAQLLPPDEARGLAGDFVGYYRAHPHAAFAAQVWTNNALLAALSLASALLLGLPVLLFVVQTGFQVGVPAGYLAAEGRTGEFLSFILPHGMLELTAVFLAMAAGLRLAWTVVDPGGRTRGRALAEEGRTTLALAGGVTAALLVSGLVEGFVTPSGLPGPVKVAVGAVLEVAFVTGALLLGRRAERAGWDGRLDTDADLLPQA